MRILFLDDDQWRHDLALEANRGHDVTYVWTAAEAEEAMAAERFDLASLDHDLGEEVDNDGMHAARWLADHPRWAPRMVVIHSWNPVAAAGMVEEIAKVAATRRVPFGPELLRLVFS